MSEFCENPESRIETTERNPIPELSHEAEEILGDLFQEDFEGVGITEDKMKAKLINPDEEMNRLFNDDFKEMPEDHKGMENSDLLMESVDTSKSKEINDNLDVAKNCPVENGQWKGDRGNSKWIPDGDYVPQKKNPEQKTYSEIFKEFGIDGINFVDGEPDFCEISKGDVEIEAFSTNRDDNFDKADLELAKQKGCLPDEVAKWRKEKGYTWHECKDMKTMQKVASIVHNNVSHRGGISEAKGSIK